MKPLPSVASLPSVAPAPSVPPAPSVTPAASMVLVDLPTHLCRLAGAPPTVRLPVHGSVSQSSVLDALEARYPMLQGTLRDFQTQLRRPFIRFFACELDLSHLAPHELLPAPVAEGREPFLIVGAIAGG